MEHKCAVCDRSAPHRCAGCMEVSYCSREHQTRHWKIHKNDCSYFTIEETPETGKGFVATRDIKAGTVILEEKAIAVAPYGDGNASRANYCCVTCGFVGGNTGKPRLCSKCGWPACSVECENDRIHATECEMFCSKKLQYPPPEYPATFRFTKFLLLLRVFLIKKKDPEIFKQVKELQWEFGNAIRGSDSIIYAEPKFLAGIMSCFDCLELGVEREEVLLLVKIFQINCHHGVFSLAGTLRFEQLYLKASRINNSCVANCRWTFGKDTEFKIRICTTVAVKKGEPITVCYTQRQCDVGTIKRQEDFQGESKQYTCKCKRCTDPTELGTFMSGIVCSDCHGKNSSGYFLPRIPWDLSSKGWECNICGKIACDPAISYTVDNIAKAIEGRAQVADDVSSGLALIQFCQEVIEKYQGKILHPNHWLIQEAARALIDTARMHWQIVGNGAMTQRCVELGLYLLSIQNTVSPGSSQSKVALGDKVMFFMADHTPQLMSQGKHQMAACNMKHYVDIQKDAFQFYKNEFTAPDGRRTDTSMIKQSIETGSQMLRRINNIVLMK